MPEISSWKGEAAPMFLVDWGPSSLRRTVCRLHVSARSRLGARAVIPGSLALKFLVSEHVDPNAYLARAVVGI